MEKHLEVNIRAVGNSPSAPFFLDLLKQLLAACGWNFKSTKFYTRQLNLESFYRNYKQLTEDYTVQADRQRFVVVYTTPAKLKQFLEFNMLQRDDVYKLLWNRYPVEPGGTAENRQYILRYLSIKSHEDAVASEIVNRLLLETIYHLYHAEEHYETFKRDVGYLRRMFDPTQNDGNEDAIVKAALRMLVDKYDELDEAYITSWFVTNWTAKWGGWRDGLLPAGKPTRTNMVECKHYLLQLFLTKR
eukprot:gene11571-13671_t